jgi:hypothetical protein
MKLVTALIFSTLALNSSQALADTVNCPNVGKIALNADVAYISYVPSMGFTDLQDIAYFMSTGQNQTEYRASKWGSVISIPNTLLNGRVSSAEVTFFLPEAAPLVDVCTLD